MSAAVASAPVKGRQWIGGRWLADAPVRFESRNPAKLDEVVGVFPDGMNAGNVYLRPNAPFRWRDQVFYWEMYDQDLIRPFLGPQTPGMGEVEIRSGQRLPGPEDDLRVTTRDVVMTETDVMTTYPELRSL